MTHDDPMLGDDEGPETAVDELLRLGRERGDRLRHASAQPAQQRPDISALARENLHDALVAGSEIQKVNFKLTFEPAWEATLLRLIENEGAEARQRQVYFYDTKQLALHVEHLVLR